MIVYRGEVDVGGGDDVAQRDVGEAAVGIKPLGGAEDRGPGVIRRHVMGPMRKNLGCCNSNRCMKLSFETRECQCASRAWHPKPAGRRRSRSYISGKNSLADEG